jgi:hypothetical protein
LWDRQISQTAFIASFAVGTTLIEIVEFRRLMMSALMCPAFMRTADNKQNIGMSANELSRT